MDSISNLRAHLNTIREAKSREENALETSQSMTPEVVMQTVETLLRLDRSREFLEMFITYKEKSQSKIVKLN